MHATADELLARRWGALEGEIMRVKKETNPVRGHARIVVPDDDRIRPFAAQIAAQALDRYVGGRILDFYARQVRLEIRALSQALVHSKEFERMTIVMQNDTRNPELGEADFVIWFQVQQADDSDIWLAHWKVRRSGNEEAANAGVDRGVPEGTPRYASFVQSVRDAAIRLGGIPSIPGAAAVHSSEKNNHVAGNGSGIVLDGKGHVLTNEHVVRTCGEIRVVDAGGQNVKATLVTSDAANDLAVLAASLAASIPANFGESRALQQGEGVVVAGYPLANLLGSGIAITTGSVSALAGPRNDSRYVQFTAPIQPGNSGGPVLDMHGNVIGMVAMALNPATRNAARPFTPQNVNFAIKTGVVRTLVESNNIELNIASPTANPLSATEVAARARKFTVKVECMR